jgi:hypothetical protein
MTGPGHPANYPQRQNILGVTQFDRQTVDFIQLTIYAVKRQLAVIVELLISTA